MLDCLRFQVGFRFIRMRQAAPMTIKIPICRYGWSFLILLCCMSSVVFVPGAFGAGAQLKLASVSIKADNKPLTQVLDEISEASGYTIQFDEEWGNEPVSLSIENKPLDKALNRVLANLNHAVIWNEAEKKISIFIIGKTGSGKSISSYPSGVSGEDQSVSGARRPTTGNRSVQRRPATRSQPEPYDRSESSERSPESERLQPDPAVSLSGRGTRFGQASSTIE